MRIHLILMACVVGMFGQSSSALAQATRTWVSGVGDDVNPCSRTAPCKTFAGAISKTAAAGVINTLDSGGFGAVTITKAITIEANGVIGGVLAAGVNGVTVNAGPSDVVTLRGLTIDGVGTGINGVRFVAGGALRIEGCVINNFRDFGVDFRPSAASRLFIANSTISGNGNLGLGTGGGIFVAPTGSGSAYGELSTVRAEGNLFGVEVWDNATVVAANTVAAGNIFNGFRTTANGAGPAVLSLTSCVSAVNGNGGVYAFGSGALIRMSNVFVSGNGTGVANVNGVILSFKNNAVDGNGFDIAGIISELLFH